MLFRSLLGFSLDIRGVDFWLITLACVAGALLGTAFIIPLRKQMLDIERLRFPTPTAVASILKSPGAGTAKAVVLVAGIVVGALIFLPTQLTTFGLGGLSQLPGIGTANGGFLSDGAIDVGKALGIPLQFGLVFAIAPFALGAGYLTGRAGMYVLSGGILAYLILNPIAYSLGWMPANVLPTDVATYGREAYNKPLGIGLLLGGALMGVLVSLPAIREAVKSIGAAGKFGGSRDELGLRTLVVAVFSALLFLFVAADMMGSKPVNDVDPVSGVAITGADVTAQFGGYTIAFADEAGLETWAAWDDAERTSFLDDINAKPGWLSGLDPHLRALIIALVGAAWIWFAGIIIAQCAGMTDWSPISGLALLTVVLVMLLAGTGAVLGAVLIGAALCVAITLAADMMGDMKTGYLVGAVPRRQQVVELIVVGIGPVVCMLTVLLIAQANLAQYGVAMGEGTETTAPQAQALRSVIIGVQGGELPYVLYGAGALMGALLGLGAFSGLGVLVGLSMYLPFIYISTYGVGVLTQMVVARIKGRVWAEDWGVPFAAGLIVGESIFALLVNSLVLVQG